MATLPLATEWQQEVSMTDDSLRKMLDEAKAERKRLDDARTSARDAKIEAMRQSGERLAARLLPRLREAEKEWGNECRFKVTDRSGAFGIDDRGSSEPEILISAHKTKFVSYTFRAWSEDGVALTRTTDRESGSLSVQGVATLADLTDDKIDLILKSLLREAYSLDGR
jgi:hypothetical protein